MQMTGRSKMYEKLHDMAPNGMLSDVNVLPKKNKLKRGSTKSSFDPD